MTRQEPMLMESPLTKRVFVVTSYKDEGNGVFTAREKHDVTEQFDALAAMRRGECELTMDGTDGCFGCSECLENIPPLANFCPNCGRAVKR